MSLVALDLEFTRTNLDQDCALIQALMQIAVEDLRSLAIDLRMKFLFTYFQYVNIMVIKILSNKIKSNMTVDRKSENFKLFAMPLLTQNKK